MDTQTGQPPPFHFMFDANAHGLGAGAQMEVSKYPGGSIQQESYRAGYRQFKPVPGRGFVYGPSGNWGNRHYYKYTPIKQNAGASGVLSQIAQPNAYKYKVANLGRLGRVDPQLPRGGSIMRVVGVAGGAEDEGDQRAFDSNYDWRNGGAQGPSDVRKPTDVGRPDFAGFDDDEAPPPYDFKGGPGGPGGPGGGPGGKKEGDKANSSQRPAESGEGGVMLGPIRLDNGLYGVQMGEANNGVMFGIPPSGFSSRIYPRVPEGK
jgi:hypothetical protein